ncbi:MAG: ATP-binding domain-containing protein [Deltaproteobacteria bacterium]|nr:ATP-binding domain-containing protein [Deltaproteobacteria bacterium]
MPTPLAPDHPLWPVLEEERRLLARVQVQLATLDLGPTTRGDYDRELLDLRDQASEARLEDLPALIDQMLQAQAIRSQRGMGAALPANPRSPYFAHLKLSERGRVRDVLVGKRSFIDAAAGITVVDWRNAPVSRIYYRYDEGDAYEEEFGDRTTEGTVLARRTVSIQDGRLTRVRTPSGTLICDAKDTWFVLDPLEGPELHGGAGAAVRPPREQAAHQGGSFQKRQKARLGLGGEETLREDKRLPEIAALIDKPQFDLITRPETGVVVLQGGAGSGKTTVMLHRVAFLHFARPERFRQKHMRVLVSQKQLVAYIGRVLPSLDVAQVPVMTVEEFLHRARTALFPGLRRPRMEYCPDAVARLKKHPAMLKILEAAVEQRTAALREELVDLCAGLRGGEAAVTRWDGGGRTLHARHVALSRFLHGGGATQPVQDRLHGWMRELGRALDQPLDDLQEALSDRALLTRVLERDAPGQFRAEHITAMVDWVARQATEREDLSDIDPDARTPVDARGDDEMDPAERLDPHDEAILVRYHQLLRGGLLPPGGNLVEYDHVAVDEAQDLSALDIQVLADATRHQSITLAGDTAQRLVFDNGFDTWTGLLEKLRIPTVDVSTLKVAYRSTAEVTQVARAILGPLADPDPPRAPRHGAPVEGFRFAEMGEEVAFLAEALRGVMGRERSANVALITRYAAQADAYYEALARAEVPHLRRVSRQDFTFTPGIDVTDVTQIKGLEYDYVVLAGTDAASYADSVESRHALHIGATRAAHQLWFTVHRPPSPLIPAALFTTV